jgi:hypothetical protein
MQVSFTQSGGFANLVKGCNLDTASLSAADGATLSQLIEESGLLHLKSSVSATARDAILYEISVATNGLQHDWTFDDATLPPSASPLISYLQSHSSPIKLS